MPCSTVSIYYPKRKRPFRNERGVFQLVFIPRTQAGGSFSQTHFYKSLVPCDNKGDKAGALFTFIISLLY